MSCADNDGCTTLCGRRLARAEYLAQWDAPTERCCSLCITAAEATLQVQLHRP
ncbi:hypothetical protein AB0C96_34900 [Streptomyces sp. NPDC048506]|uniref:hypothetical protein n=1 Tax=Streptomyces sp. NPDC048506 TaxID=3155028 RepID=UPI003415B176